MRTKNAPFLFTLFLLFVGCREGGSDGSPSGASSSVVSSSSAGGAGGTGGAGGSGGSGGGGSGGGEGAVVFGVNMPPNDTNLFAASVHAALRVDGVVVQEETLGTGAVDIIPTPLEYKTDMLPEGAAVELVLEVDYANGAPLLVSQARTSVVAGRTSLVRVPVTNYGCYVSCDPMMTCRWNRCFDPYVSPEVLEEYEADWASYSWCKPKAPPMPVVEVGLGETDFTPLHDGDVAQVHEGFQGGHHIYLALRMRGLQQYAQLKIGGHFPTLETDIGPFSYMFAFADNPAAGACEGFGIIARLDDLKPVSELLGQPLDVTVEVSDTDGDAVTVKRSIELSTTVLTPF